MIHARKDYQRFQDPAVDDPTLLGEGCTPIAEDEPVMLFRAKDKHFLNVLIDYFHHLRMDPNVDKKMLDAIAEHSNLAAEWQNKNGTKTPDIP